MTARKYEILRSAQDDKMVFRRRSLFGIKRMKAKGGMRCAFPPYSPKGLPFLPTFPPPVCTKDIF
jgi:hypothetical protein